MINLSEAIYGELPSVFEQAPYDRSQMRSGILHIGPSAFFRAHLAVFIDDLLAKAAAEGRPLDWGITAVSLKNPHTFEKLSGQDFLYTLTSKGAHGIQPRVIGSIRDILVAQQNPELAVQAAADPNIKLITLTVTQKGYYYSAERGVDFDHPDIQNCLNTETEDMSAIGLIVEALDRRRLAGIAPPTIMSCDNMDANGAHLRSAVLAYAGVKSSDLHDWIAEYVRFPSTMVDRITPGTSEKHASVVLGMGVIDALPIEAEEMPDVALVIERSVSIDPNTGRPVDFPQIENPAVLYTNNVHKYERMKLRLLNGAHMALGCIGYLAGHTHAHEAMRNLDIRTFIQGFMVEAAQTLIPARKIDVNDYIENLIERLDNEDISDPLTRLVRNGTDKVGPRLLGSLRDCISASLPHPHLSFAVAAWIEYLKRLDANGRLPGAAPDSEPNDASAARLGLSSIVHGDMTDPSALFAVRAVFGDQLSSNSELSQDVRWPLDRITSHGIKDALSIFNKEHHTYSMPQLPLPHIHAMDGDRPSVYKPH